MLRDFEPRLYQQTILATATQKNTLVVLPTGMGKTAVALLLAAQRLSLYPNSKILFLAPTKPLVEQHLETFRKYLHIPEEQLAVFTGEMPSEVRAEKWKTAKIVFSTPQGFENDVISGKIDLDPVSLMVFDEAHHAVGDYAYVFLAKQYQRKASFPRILGLTASPGSELEKIEEVCKNLFIENVEIRTDSDPDVVPYVQEIKTEWIKVELPAELKHVQVFLQQCIKSKMEELKKQGVRTGAFFSKTELLKLQGALHAKLASGERDFSVMKSVSLLAEVMKAQHALELLETQSIAALICYFESFYEQAKVSKVKATQNLAADINFKSAYIKAQSLKEKGIEHPKLAAIREIISKEFEKDKFAKIILFTQYRDSAVKMAEQLKGIPNVVPSVFVGQAKKGATGLSQKKQKEMLDEFRDGLSNVLIATSVAEEGLDVPKVDIVIFYEPVPAAVRHIQRRGRTGRQEKGRVIILMAKGTRDEGYSWSATRKEKKMNTMLSALKGKMKGISQPTIESFTPEQNVKIVADYREKGGGVIKELIDIGLNVELKQLPAGDYIVSERVAIELKLVADFVDSIIDGRLLQQLKEMRLRFQRPLVIIEGSENIYSVRNIHPNAIRGMLATIAVSYNIPILHTKDSAETASLIYAIAKREQDDSSKSFSVHTEKKNLSLKEQQEYIVSALPSVGASLAKELLKQFKTVKNIVNASEEDLKKVDKVGEKIAKNIKDVSEKEYSD